MATAPRGSPPPPGARPGAPSIPHPNPSLVCSSCPNQSVTCPAWGTPVPPCKCKSGPRRYLFGFLFYFIFSEGWGRGCGNCSRDHALGSCRGGGPTAGQPPGTSTEARPRGHLLPRTLGACSSPTGRAVEKPLAGPLRTRTGMKTTALCLGHSCGRAGCRARASGEPEQGPGAFA